MNCMMTSTDVTTTQVIEHDNDTTKITTEPQTLPNNNQMNVLCLGCSDSGKSKFIDTLTKRNTNSMSENFESLSKNMSTIVKSFQKDQESSSIQCSELTSTILNGQDGSSETCTKPDEIPLILKEFEQIWNTTLKEYYNENKDCKHFSENMNQVFKNGTVSAQECKKYLYNSTNATQRQCLRRFSTTCPEINMVTAGGKKMERRRWNSLDMEGTNVLLLFVSLSEFNQQTIEDSKTNRMDDSLKTFKDLITKKQLKKSRKVVIFSKPDIVQEKLSSNALYQREVCELVKEELKSISNLNLERSVVNSTISEYEKLFHQHCKDSNFEYHVCNTTDEEEVETCMSRIVSNNNSQPFISKSLKRQDEKFTNKLFSSLNNNKLCDISFV